VIDEAEVNTLLSQYLPGPVNAMATQPTVKESCATIFRLD